MLMRAIRQMFAPQSLHIRDWCGPEEIDTEKRWIKPALECVVHQAMQDGMLKIRFGVDRETGEAFMKYFGPIYYSPEKRIWWDMVPAPVECYPGMLQVCLSLAELDQSLPIKGTIPAVMDRKRLKLELSVDDVDCFQIAWDAAYASDRAQSETPLPEEGGKADRSVS